MCYCTIRRAEFVSPLRAFRVRCYLGLHRNIAEQLIEKGLATAVRHKRDDEDRSPEYDKLMAAEQACVSTCTPRYHYVY